MKKFISINRAHALTGIAICTLLFAFTRPMGTHSVQVYLDDKLVIDQHLDFKGNAPKVKLAATENYNRLIVKYDECGRTVTGRKITVKDADNKMLKAWYFKGSANGFGQPMEFRFKDIMALNKNGNNTLKLYYSSNDFPEGQQVASLVISGNAITAKR